jgi:hypothetical protein
MQVEQMVELLRKLADPASPERKEYRARREAGVCRLCGGENPAPSYCANCYETVCEAKRLAREQRLCSTCFSAPVAPAKTAWAAKKVSQCMVCRERDRQKAAARGIERAIGL